jgi:hypothetical protein
MGNSKWDKVEGVQLHDGDSEEAAETCGHGDSVGSSIHSVP